MAGAVTFPPRPARHAHQMKVKIGCALTGFWHGDAGHSPSYPRCFRGNARPQGASWPHLCIHFDFSTGAGRASGRVDSASSARRFSHTTFTSSRAAIA